MADYMHDEWCATKLDLAPPQDCDCVRGILLGKDAKVAQLEQRIEGMPEFVPLPDGKPTNTFEAYLAWKLKAEKAEQRIEELERGERQSREFIKGRGLWIEFQIAYAVAEET